MEASRGGPLTLPDHTADRETLAQATYHTALARLRDVIAHADNPKVVLRAIEIANNLYLGELALRMEYSGASKTTPQPVAAMLAPDQVEVVRDLLAQRRQLLKAGGS